MPKIDQLIKQAKDTLEKEGHTFTKNTSVVVINAWKQRQEYRKEHKEYFRKKTREKWRRIAGSDGVQIFIKDLCGRTSCLDVNLEFTIAQIKEHIYDIIDLPIDS